jgi:hypothetical protein
MTELGGIKQFDYIGMVESLQDFPEWIKLYFSFA